MHRAAASLLCVTLTVVSGLGCVSNRPHRNGRESAAATEATGNVNQRLETLVPELMEKAHVPGLQIAVLRDGKVVWERGFGLTNSENSDPVTTRTVFEAASLTKPLFAYAVMKLVDRGTIELDTSIVDVLPRELLEGFLGHSTDAEAYPREQMAKITPRQVLSHSAGMHHGDRPSPYTLLFEPGSDWSYSSDGYRLLQILVEHIEGRPLDETIQTLVLDPLEMSASAMVWRDDFE